MAITAKRCVSFSSGGLEFLPSFTGAPSVTATNPPPNCAYSASLVSGDDFTVNFTNSTYICISFKVRFSSVAAGKFFGDTAYDFQLDLRSDGEIDISQGGSVVGTTSGANITANTWHHINVIYHKSATGTLFDLYVDSGNVFSRTASTDWEGTTAHKFWGFSGATTQFAEIVILGDTVSTNFNTAGYDVYEFMVAGTGYTTSGTALDGGTWANTGEQPLSETNLAEYTASSAAGHAVTDGSSKSGPSGAVTGTFVGAEWNYWAKRGGGGGTTHTLRYGNSVDTINTNGITLTTSPAAYVLISSSATAVPTSSEYFAMGMEVSGNQDFIMYEMYAVLAVEVPAAASSLIYKPYRFNHILVR